MQRTIQTTTFWLLGLVLSGCSVIDQTASPGLAAETAISTLTTQQPEQQAKRLAATTVNTEVMEVEPPPKHLWAYLARETTWAPPEKAEILAAREYWLEQKNLFPVLGARATPILQYIVSEIERRELPLELALIPIIESSLNPWAYSSQHAAGLWQITPATADHFSLHRSWWFDARYDIRDATHAALDYLTSLNERYDGDWYLTLAAYNAGPGRVDRALRKKRKAGSEDHDFWSLQLPRETRRYIPKLLGLLSVLQNADYDSQQWPDTPIVADWQPVNTGGQIEIARAAALVGVDEETLRRMNPGHLRWATAPEAGDTLWVPAERAAQFAEAVAKLPQEERVRWHRYEIQPGDSLIRIAREFGSQVNLIREVNDLSGNLIRAGDELLIPHGGDWSKSLQLAKRSVRANKRPERYRVRRGDSLWEIARRFDLSVDRLVRWNSLSAESYLQPGQTLRLQP